MPLFTFLIINGFFKTKDLKRYIFRLLRLAIITQVIISVLGVINFKFVPEYVTNIYYNFNIVFSFVLSLLFINGLNNILLKKYDNIKEVFKNIAVITVIPCIYGLFEFNGIIKLDYEFMVLILSTLFYILHKIKEINNYVYYIMLIITIILYTSIAVILNPINVTIFLVIPLLFVFNEDIKSKNLKLQKMFYSVFFIQHTLLYLGALIYTIIKFNNM